MVRPLRVTPALEITASSPLHRLGIIAAAQAPWEGNHPGSNHVGEPYTGDDAVQVCLIAASASHPDGEEPYDG